MIKTVKKIWTHFWHTTVVSNVSFNIACSKSKIIQMAKAKLKQKTLQKKFDLMRSVLACEKIQAQNILINIVSDRVRKC